MKTKYAAKVTGTLDVEISPNGIKIMFSLEENGDKKEASQTEPSNSEDKKENVAAGEDIVKTVSAVLMELMKIGKTIS